MRRVGARLYALQPAQRARRSRNRVLLAAVRAPLARVGVSGSIAPSVTALAVAVGSAAVASVAVGAVAVVVVVIPAICLVVTVPYDLEPMRVDVHGRVLHATAACKSDRFD